jgi:hypothetical protein
MEQPPRTCDLTVHNCDLIPEVKLPFCRKQSAKIWHIVTADQFEAQISTCEMLIFPIDNKPDP